MKPDKAKELIKETFEQPFDKDRFVWFVKNLFPDKIEFRNKVYSGNYIKEAYRQYIRKYEQIGKFEDEEGSTIDLLVVELLKGQSVERARTSQRNFIAQYLKNKNHREGALVAFYSEGSDDWRFSFIKMEYSLEKRKDDLTPAKRFSFLVGKDEKSHTAQNQLAGLLTMQAVPLMQELEQAFNIETVTKEFFEKYKQLFLDMNDHIEKEIKKSKQLREELESRNIDSAAFTKKLLGQIVFLYFLQKKGWLGVTKEGKFSEGKKYYLRSLLNEAEEKNKLFFNDYLVYLFYEALASEHNDEGVEHYYKKLKCRIPFLNGGLFESDYNWEKITVDIPNKLFTNSNPTKEGDIGDGILDVFDRYNFTVKEDEPLEKEVAVDPEMLGKVFENLLEVKDRKSKGAFYTPREIVHYMCQESLIAYLDTSVNGEATSFQKIGTDQTDMFGNKARKGQLPLEAEHGSKIKVERKDIEKYIREGIAAIDNDTRVESKGEETTSYSYQLPESIRTNAKEIDKALANIRICDPAIGSGAFPVGMMNEIVKAREILSVYLKEAKPKDRTPYELKRHTIQECIYGVDIDHSAIDIAKLRLWLSLVVDEEDFHRIKPLPNLDYKIMFGSSLEGIAATDLFRSALLTQVENNKQKFFAQTEINEKKKLRKEITKLFKELTGSDSHFDFEIYFSEVFHNSPNGKGFDIIIGNPPYLNIEKISPKDKEMYLQVYGENGHLGKRYDIYQLFILKGLHLLNKTGVMSFILPNTFLVGHSYHILRKRMVTQSSIQRLIDLPQNVFESATVDNVIFLLSKPHRPNNKIEILKLFSDSEVSRISSQSWDDTFNLIQDELTFDNQYKINVHTNPVKKAVYSKLFINSQPIGDITESSQGIIIYKTKEDSKKGKYTSDNFKAGWKKLLRGTNIGLYQNKWGGEYLHYGDWLWSSRDEKYFKQPKILLQALRNKSLKRRLVGTYDDERYYNAHNLANIISKENSDYDLKYILALFNSQLLNVWYKDHFPNVNINPNDFRQLPIKKIERKNQKSFITIVDKILEMKKQDPKANTSSRERQIDVMVYHLYKLTYEEAKVIDAELSEEEFEKYKV